MIYRLILALVVVVSFFSCGEDGFPLIRSTTIPGDDPALSGSGNVEGNWVVRQFVDEGEDETASFSGIVLAFEPDGVFKMRRNSNLAATGNWNLENNGRELNIVVPVFENQNESLGEDLYEIHDSWQLSDISDDEIHLVEEDEFFVLVRQ